MEDCKEHEGKGRKRAQLPTYARKGRISSPVQACNNKHKVLKLKTQSHEIAQQTKVLCMTPEGANFRSM